jgi:membrane protein
MGGAGSGWIAIARDAWRSAGGDDAGLLAAGVAFYGFLALVPLLTAFVLSYGLVAEPADVVAHVRTLAGFMPQDAAEMVGEQLRDMTEASGSATGFALAAALAVAIYGASRAATAMIRALNVAYDVAEARGFLRRTALALAVTVGAVALMIVAVLALSVFNLIEAVMPDLGGAGRAVLRTAAFAIAAAAIFFLLALAYRHGPNRGRGRGRGPWLTPGAILATIVWIAATLGFSIYVANFASYNATYGSLGAVIVFLTWLYLSAYIVILGAELNASAERHAASERAVHRQQIAPLAELEAGGD